MASETQSHSEYWQAIFEQLPTGVVIIDGQGRVKDFNQAAVNLLGHTLKEQLWVDVIKASFAPKEDDGHEISLVDGRLVNVAITSLKERAGEMIILNDITATRTFEFERARMNRLQEMGEMLAHLAHQIRTPLASAMLYVKNLAHPNLTKEKHDNFVNKIRYCHQDIEQQIRDLLAFAKGGDSLLQAVEVNDFLDVITKKTEVRLKEANGELIVDNCASDTTFLCQSDALEGAINNLIDNALNANAKKIYLNVVTKNDDTMVFNVLDDGDGMDEATLQKVMRPFYTTRAKGTGLGLAVVDAVVKAHQGQMKIISKVGVGSTFSIQIPLIHENVQKEPQ